MGLSTFWTNITGPRIREITPPKNCNGARNQRPATSSGVRTVRKTPSFEDGDDTNTTLNATESFLTRNIISPPREEAPTLQEKKSKRRSRGLSLSRRSVFGGSKEETRTDPVPEIPTLPTLSAIYSRQSPHNLNDAERPGTAVSTIPPTPTTPTTRLPVLGGAPKSPTTQQSPPNAVGQIFELPAEPATTTRITAELPAPHPSEIQIKKARRRSIGEVLTGKRSKSMGNVPRTKATDVNAPPVPAKPVVEAKAATQQPDVAPKTVRSRRNSNASVASRASMWSRKSKRKSWWQRAKAQDKDDIPLLPADTHVVAKTSSGMGDRKTERPEAINVSGIPAVSTTKKAKDDDDTASIRTTRSEKATARAIKKTPQREASKKKRPQSTASHVRRKRRSSWWASSNPDDSEDDTPLPPVPLLVRSNTTTPDSSPTNSENGYAPATAYAVRGDNIKAPRPISGMSTKSTTYTPRSAAKSFLVSTTPVSDNVRKSVRNSLHAASQDPDSGFENDRNTYCLSAEQQREWEKLKHLMAVMDRRRDATRKTFGEESVADLFPPAPTGGARKVGGVEEKGGVKYANRDALAALEVGVAK